MTYLDTSFVVSLYTPDANSVMAAGILQSQNDTLLLSTLGEVETVNAMQLRVFRKEISRPLAAASLQQFDHDIQAGVFQVHPLAEKAFDRARKLSIDLTAKLGTHTADLLHVAAALELGASAFFSFDLQQRKMARSCGLVVNPQAIRR